MEGRARRENVNTNEGEYSYRREDGRGGRGRSSLAQGHAAAGCVVIQIARSALPSIAHTRTTDWLSPPLVRSRFDLHPRVSDLASASRSISSAKVACCLRHPNGCVLRSSFVFPSPTEGDWTGALARSFGPLDRPSRPLISPLEMMDRQCYGQPAHRHGLPKTDLPECRTTDVEYALINEQSFSKACVQCVQLQHAHIHSLPIARRVRR